MTIYIKAAIALGLAVVLWWAYGLWSGHYVDKGRAQVQAIWDKDTKAREGAEKLAVAKRNEENRLKILADEQREKDIKENFNGQLTQVRNDLLAAKRLRVGTAICGPRPAGTTSSETTSGSTATDTGGGLVSEEADRDFKSLILQVEQGFAAGRACQAFVRPAAK